MKSSLRTARRGSIFTTAPVQGGGAITHGDQLTVAATGPWRLQGVSKGSESLQTLTLPGRGYWRTDSSSEFIPTGDYVYDNSPSNHGGTVPSGGLTIDGVVYPAGTRVLQFVDISNQDFYCTADGTTFLFRGLRGRDTQKAPGKFNMAAGTTSKVSVHYSDFGGAGPADIQYNEVPIKIAAGGGGTILRNYFSYTTTAIQCDRPQYDILENYIEKLTKFYGLSPPPGESTDKHLNGINIIGGQDCLRVERNYVVGQNPDESGHTINDTDCIYFNQYGGPFNGTGTNSDGTIGYRIKDNYVGGTGYCFYLGKHVGDPAGTVNNFVFTGNRVTTAWWPNGGANGPASDIPPWGVNGNVQSNNLWADGANVGQSFI